jgi:HK97 family phage prohead protease
MSHPTDNLVRMRYGDDAALLRSSDDGSTGRTLHGHFAVFDRWTEIDSWYEGRFMERVGEKAFTRTFKERGDKIRVLYDHGHDPSIGNKPLGAPDVLRVDKGVGPYYESELFEASYVDDLIPALRAGQLGASFRFRVTGEQWVEPKRETEHNPNKLPERTITDVDLYEFGPVTFPAYEDATAGVRSGSDQFIERLLADQSVLARYIDHAGPAHAAHYLASIAASGPSSLSVNVPASGGSESDDARTRVRAITRARAALL